MERIDAIQIDLLDGTRLGSWRNTGNACPVFDSGSGQDNSGDDCGTVNGDTYCVTDQNCGTVNGEDICVDSPPMTGGSNCTVLGDGSYICDSTAPDTEKPEIEPDPDDTQPNPRPPGSTWDDPADSNPPLQHWPPPITLPGPEEGGEEPEPGSEDPVEEENQGPGDGGNESSGGVGTCTGDQVYVDGRCQESTSDGTDQGTCPAGTIKEGDVCVQAPECDPPLIWDGQQCRQASSYTDASCDGGEPACEGDPIQCASARYLFQLRCFQKQGLDEVRELANDVEDLPALTSDIDLSNMIDTSSTLTGSCPAPDNISLLGTTMTIDYGPFCTVAGYISPLVIGFSLLAAGRIVGGGIS